MELKVGQQVEVVEVLKYGGFDDKDFKIGGHTIHFNRNSLGGGRTLCNGRKPDHYNFYRDNCGCTCLNMFGSEVKPVGRLTVTKIK